MTVVSSPSIKKGLIVFIKSPIPGEVKTRLIPQLSRVEAAELYKCFVLDTVRSISLMSTEVNWQAAYQPHPKALDLSWMEVRTSPEVFRQEGRSLGERLTHAFGVAFGQGAQHVVIIGSDAPNLPFAYLDQAFQELSDSDVVLGPAVDGGYYLIGLSRPCINLFDEVSWSTDQVFERTAQNAQKQKYRLRVLPSHYDIDTFDDLLKLHQHLLRNPKEAPSTKKFLSHLAKIKPALITS